MNDIIPFLVVGVAAGSVYSLAGMGLVVTYKTSGFFNFAHGAIAAAAAYAFYDLHFRRGLPWGLALLITVGGLAVVGGVLLEQLARRLTGGPAVLGIAATVGLLLAVQGGLYWRYGSKALPFPAFVTGTGLSIGTVEVSRQSLLGIAVAAVSAAGLFVLFRSSRAGVAMRAVVDDPGLLGLAGTSPTRTRVLAWTIGTGFAALSGILIAPSLGLDATLLTLLVVQAFGAAALGRFSSLPLTYAGGLVVGVGSALLTKFVSSTPALAGLPSAVPFLVLVVVLIVRPPRGYERSVLDAPQASGGFTFPASLRRIGLGAAVVGVLAVPYVVGARLPVYINGAAFVVVFLSLALLVWTSGQISLCHVAFTALGASTFAHLTTGLGLPWFLALAGAGLAVVPLGALVAIPAVRLSGVYLALATFGFGILTQRLLYGTGAMFGSIDLRSAPRPFFARSDEAFFHLAAAVAAGSCLVVVAVLRSRLGRLLGAMGDSPVALVTNGLGVHVTRLLVFCLSAFLAGMAGALFIAASGKASGRGFPALNSLLWLTVLVICGRRAIASSIGAAVLLAVLPAYVPDNLVAHQALIFGVVATVAAVVGARAAGRPAEERIRRSPVRARLADRPIGALRTTPALARAAAALPSPVEAR